jgi:hypothetical protein
MPHCRFIFGQIIERLTQRKMKIGAVLVGENGFVEQRCQAGDERPICLADFFAIDEAEIRDRAPWIQD